MVGFRSADRAPAYYLASNSSTPTNRISDPELSPPNTEEALPSRAYSSPIDPSHLPYSRPHQVSHSVSILPQHRTPVAAAMFFQRRDQRRPRYADLTARTFRDEFDDMEEDGSEAIQRGLEEMEEELYLYTGPGQASSLAAETAAKKAARVRGGDDSSDGCGTPYRRVADDRQTYRPVKVQCAEWGCQLHLWARGRGGGGLREDGAAGGSRGGVDADLLLLEGVQAVQPWSSSMQSLRQEPESASAPASQPLPQPDTASPQSAASTELYIRGRAILPPHPPPPQQQGWQPVEQEGCVTNWRGGDDCACTLEEERELASHGCPSTLFATQTDSYEDRVAPNRRKGTAGEPGDGGGGLAPWDGAAAAHGRAGGTALVAGARPSQRDDRGEKEGLPPVDPARSLHRQAYDMAAGQLWQALVPVLAPLVLTHMAARSVARSRQPLEEAGAEPVQEQDYWQGEEEQDPERGGQHQWWEGEEEEEMSGLAHGHEEGDWADEDEDWQQRERQVEEVGEDQGDGAATAAAAPAVSRVVGLLAMFTVD